MNKKDLGQIQELFDKSFKSNFQESFHQIWVFNLEPVLSDLIGKVDNLPTKEYVDEKIAGLRADINKKFAPHK